MLIDLFSSFFSGKDVSIWQVLFQFLAIVAVIFISLPVHEFSHAFAAYKFGDNTAKANGRLTLNPFKHLTVMGTALIIVAGFGYAKPVPINPYQFRFRNKPAVKMGEIVVSLAGPLSNLLLAILSMAILRFTVYPFLDSSSIFFYLFLFLSVFAQTNISLAVFNLLPIPPLDGSHILLAVLPRKISEKLEANMQIFSYVLFALIIFGAFNNVISVVSSGIFNGLTKLFF